MAQHSVGSRKYELSSRFRCRSYPIPLPFPGVRCLKLSLSLSLLPLPANKSISPLHGPLHSCLPMYLLRQTCMPKRVSTFSNDLADGAILCQAVASHVPHFTVKGGPLHGFIPVHSTGEKTSAGRRRPRKRASSTCDVPCYSREHFVNSYSRQIETYRPGSCDDNASRG